MNLVTIFSFVLILILSQTLLSLGRKNRKVINGLPATIDRLLGIQMLNFFMNLRGRLTSRKNSLSFRSYNLGLVLSE
jgi:hypothetical protein